METSGLEHIDTVKGPDGLLRGRTVPGDLINRASKVPVDTSICRLPVTGQERRVPAFLKGNTRNCELRMPPWISSCLLAKTAPARESG